MQLARAFVVVAALAASTHADTGFLSKVQVYTDSDHTTVISPVVSAQADVTTDTNVSMGYLVDSVSSASVDIVSQASKIEMHDTRHQLSLGASHVFGALTARAGYSYSTEHDYLSHSINLNLTDDLNDKNTQIGVGYGVSINTVGRSGDENFARSLNEHHLAISWTQTVNPRFATQVTYELGYDDGYQASPYRFVPVRMSADAAPEFWVPETDPDSRFKHALVFGANHAVGERNSIQGDFRIYHDTWGITSETFGARYFVSLGPRTELRLRERYYTQGAANFYQSVYMAPQKYMAFDRELSPLWSETLGAKLIYDFSDHFEGEAKLDVFYYSYSDFIPLQSRTGANIGLGVSLAY